jgi:hypothetical protein
VLSGGEMVEEGSHSELMARKGEYYKFYTLQFQAMEDIPHSDFISTSGTA